MLCTNEVYKLSAYTLMANVALADTITMTIAGIACGCDILWSDRVYSFTEDQYPFSSAEILPNSTSARLRTYENETYLLLNNSKKNVYAMQEEVYVIQFMISFLSIAAWTAGVISYAMLGLNRCIAICYYGTKAKAFNQVSVAIVLSLCTWMIGVVAALLGTIPDPIVGVRRDMWTVSFVTTEGKRPGLFIASICIIDCIGVGIQWICSIMVLLRIREVKQRIYKNKLNQGSANRFHKQARLTFQFFFPSLLCTVSTFLYFFKPFFHDFLKSWQMILLHVVWLCSHLCNPFIYAYFNDRMRHTYRIMLSCSMLYYKLHQRRRNHLFNTDRQNGTSIGLFLSSFQSREFEQLCEFIMRVNPLYDSSEGWRESCDDESLEEVFFPSLSSSRSTQNQNSFLWFFQMPLHL
ncbi:unnamed protein product [Angiostrongylus costaricensis]|uniref:7TM_GPCR_Srx domain-containing protein n=1 Tax=Angiostrongylus costaricensis TaxID=334426 RepID=A0A0R3PBA4_ANGCS|nr:unnamed protein product [Angiostrongylus costaricensis]